MASAAKDFDNSIHSVAMSAVLNLGNLVGLLCLFGFLLGHPSLLQLLAPRFDAADVAAAAGHSTSRRRRLWLPWGWALEAWRHHKVRLADDLDALAMLRFCVLGLKFSTIGSLMAVFLVPAYYAGRGRAPGFNAFNISNLRGDGGSFWLVVVAAYVLVGAFLHFAVKEWHLFLVLRREHFERLARGKRGPGAAQALRSVIVEFVPPDARQQDGSGVRRFFEDLFPLRGVHSCVLQPDTSQFHRDSRALDQPSTRQRLLQLRRAVVSREPAVREASGGRAACAACGYAPDAGSTWDLRLDSMLAETPGGERKEAGAAATPAAAKFHYGSQQPPTEDWELWENVLHPAGDLALGVADRTRQAAAIVQDLAIGRAHGSETAFVTLCSVADRVVAEQLVISHGEAWRVRAAPEARDVVWENAAVPLAQTRNRSIVAHAGLLCGLVFWSVPVSSIQAWTSLDETELGWTRSAVGMLVYTFLQGYLPVLALMALQAALPIAFMIIATRYERYKVRSEIQQILMRRNFYYQLATVYVTVVAATLSQTLHGQLREVFRRPSALLEILREEVPAVACYFNNYVMARIGIGLPMMLLCPLLARVSPCAWLKRRLTGGAAAGAEGAAKVPQQQRAADLETAAAEAAAATSTATAAAAEPAPGLRHSDLSGEASNLGLVLVLGLTYCVVAPSIMPLCMLYFALAFFVYCWLFLYVYTPQLDCRGECWYELFNGAMIGLDLGTISLAALASAFVGFESPHFYALLVLFFLVLAFHFCWYVYRIVPSRVLSVEDAHAVDSRCEEDLVASLLRTDYYVDPLLTAVASEPAASTFTAQSAAEPGEEASREAAAAAGTGGGGGGGGGRGSDRGAKRQRPAAQRCWPCAAVLGLPLRTAGDRAGSGSFLPSG